MYQKNEIITDNFVIEQIIEKKGFLELLLKNKDSSVKAFLKDNVDLFLRTYKVGDKVVCQAKVRMRQDESILEVFKIQRYDFIPSKIEEENININELTVKLDSIISSIKDKDYKLILEDIFKNNEIRELFIQVPASQKNHHNYLYGLLKHSIEVVDIATFLGSYFQPSNLELIKTAALLHDLGKIKSYEFKNGQILKTESEHLLGHLSLSMLYISNLLSEEVDPHKLKLLYHLILSHHGKKENGSPVECKMKESQILHYADLISSDITYIQKLTFVNHWSKLDNLTNKTWYNEKT